ncbi:MAG TPA: gamma-glutamyltransferase [Candidatus Binataceae bacterium]|nr:gamma-glutamyltransferase [Candidatus Binataceae bacterium]
MKPFPARRARSENWRRIGLALCALLLIGGVAIPSLAADGHKAMVVSESAAAAEAGLAILKQGGNAIDAACATSLAVGVTSPAACGIGGGGFMLIYIAAEGKFYALDYREAAPKAAYADMFIRDGHPNEELAKDGPLAVAVPGEMAGLEAALKRFGTMNFQQVAAPAIKLARDGFPVSPHLAGEIRRMAKDLAGDPGLKEIFLSDGEPAGEGQTIYEKNLATTLERVGTNPSSKFYGGALGSEFVTYLEQHGGLITADDLADYQPIWRDPLHRAYQGAEVYTMPPPSSGGVLLEMLGMLEPGHLPGLGLNSPPYLVRLIEVMRQGFIDRADYADPAYVHVPLDVLLSPAHINEARDRAMHRKGAEPVAPAADHGTSNLCVVDEVGNVVEVTTTINTVFGAKMTIPKLGIILNDEMDDFSVAPGVANAYRLSGAVANSVAPGKRPLSSMTPIIVERKGKPVLAAGGSGGPTIITGVLQVGLNVLDFHLDPEPAVIEPRVHEQATPDVVLVEEKMPEKARSALDMMGYKLRVIPELGAVSAITIALNNIKGAFDPRKGGGAVGY